MLKSRTAEEKHAKKCERARVLGNEPPEKLVRKPFKRKHSPPPSPRSRAKRTRKAPRPVVKKETREAVNARSKGVCEYCGIRPATEIHHVRTRSAHREYQDDLDNLVHLCEEDHIPLAHSKNRRVFDLWFVATYRDRSDRIGFTAWLSMKIGRDL